jgi:hypothetical protein
MKCDRPRTDDLKIISDQYTQAGEKGLLLDFFASELRLRGDNPVVQPHVHNGDIFCWNGEVSLVPWFPSIFGPQDTSPVMLTNAFIEKIFEGMDVSQLQSCPLT